MTTDPTLPAPIADYFEADRRGPEAVAACFTPQAVVLDEGRTHQGREAIRAWKQAASSAYRYEVRPLSLTAAAGEQVVLARVTGTFPGSPVDLRYRFRLADGRVAALEITA
ncbi:MAG: nuclear transport factor 2 family protein [Aquincola tertiaricarbonis]